MKMICQQNQGIAWKDLASPFAITYQPPSNYLKEPHNLKKGNFFKWKKWFSTDMLQEFLEHAIPYSSQGHWSLFP